MPVIWHDDDVYFGSADHPNRLQVKDFTVDELKALCGRQATAATTTKAFPTTNSSNSSSCTSDYNIFAGSGGDGDAVLPAGSSPSGSSVDEEQSQEPQALLRLFRDRATRQKLSRCAPLLYMRCALLEAIPSHEYGRVHCKRVLIHLYGCLHLYRASLGSLHRLYDSFQEREQGCRGQQT